MKSLNNWGKITEKVVQYRNECTDTQYFNKLCEFLVAAEDHRFWQHHGVDLISLARAIWKTKIHKKREGGSTVAMQLVRTITGDYNLSLRRKIREIYYALKVSSFLKKHEVLKIYLSIAYFGWNMHGIEQACKRLGYDIQNLTNYEAASLIARLKYPEPRYFSKSKSKLITYRAEYIIKRYAGMESNTLVWKSFQSQTN